MTSRPFLLMLVLSSMLVTGEALFYRYRGLGNRGVTAYRIAEEADSYVGSIRWNYVGCKGGPRFCFSNKCNLFVNDMLVNANAKVPRRHTDRYSPIGANEWGNPHSSYVLDTGCYDTVDWSAKQMGDVIAFPVSRGSGHVGIVYSDSEYISAKAFRIEKTGYPDRRRVVLWRYRYSDPDC